MNGQGHSLGSSMPQILIGQDATTKLGIADQLPEERSLVEDSGIKREPDFYESVDDAIKSGGFDEICTSINPETDSDDLPNRMNKPEISGLRPHLNMKQKTLPQPSGCMNDGQEKLKFDLIGESPLTRAPDQVTPKQHQVDSASATCTVPLEIEVDHQMREIKRENEESGEDYEKQYKSCEFGEDVNSPFPVALFRHGLNSGHGSPAPSLNEDMAFENISNSSSEPPNESPPNVQPNAATPPSTFSLLSGKCFSGPAKHIGRYKCPLCDYSCLVKYNLAKHVRTHTGEKPYKCSQCDYRATTTSSLRTHVLRHNTEAQHKCIICDYSSNYKLELSKHIKNHLGVIQHKCTHCDFFSYNKYNLTRHARKHSEVKPYKCSQCDYTSDHRYSFVLHTKEHRNVTQ